MGELKRESGREREWEGERVGELKRESGRERGREREKVGEREWWQHMGTEFQSIYIPFLPTRSSAFHRGLESA